MRKENTRQYVLALYLLSLPLFMISLHSCEFDSDKDNFVFLEKPEEAVPIGIELTGINPDELIYVYNNSYFKYTVHTGGKDLFAYLFFLDGNLLNTFEFMDNEHTDFNYMLPEITDNEIHELKLVVALKTGTGSLAEYAGYEMYAGEFNFKIKVVPFLNGLNIRETISQDNHIKLEWDKPADREILGYEVYNGDKYSGELLSRIINPDETFFIDPDFAYGYKHYTVIAYVKNSIDATITDNITVGHSNMDERNFEMYRVSLNELLIKWNNPNPFPCKYVLTYENGGIIKIENGLNEAIIPIGSSFPKRHVFFALYIIPQSADIDQYDLYPHVIMGYSDKSFFMVSFTADPANNMLLGLNFTTFERYKLPSMEKESSVNHTLKLHSNCQVQVDNQGMVALSDNENFVHIYSDHSLSHEITKLYLGNYPFHLVSGNKLLIEERSGFKIHDITTGAVICSRHWVSEKTGAEIETTATISPDGKYVYVLCRDYHSPDAVDEWTELYEITTDHALRLLEKTEIKDIQSITFHPLKSTEVIIQYIPNKQNKFVVMDILTKEQKEIKGEFMNIDPFNGNLLFGSEEYRDAEPILYVLDKDYSQEKIKVELSSSNGWSSSRLYHNHLFYNASYLDLSLLKEWKQ